METKIIGTYIKAIDGRKVTGLASIFGNVDSYGDIVHKGAFRKTIEENASRIRHLWMHNYMDPPTATIQEMKEIGKRDLPSEVREKFPEAAGGLQVTREYLNTPRGDEILAGLTANPPAITEMSFGYDPVKFDFEELDLGDGKTMMVRNLREVRLYDISDVNWGANPATVASKAAVPYKDTGAADEGAEWSAPTLKDFTTEMWDDLSDAEKTRIASHFAWQASSPPETFGDLKLPHHQAGTSGVGKAVWRGVAAAMAALLGARGGVSIPDGDRKAVYNHLAKHYAQWDKEVPDFKFFECATALRNVIDLKEGRVLSSSNLEKLKNALSVLEEILLAAEPPEDPEKVRALTEQVLKRLAIAERDPILISVRLP